MHLNARLGIILMFFSALSFTCGDVGIKVLGQNLSPWQLTSGRSILGLALALVLSRFQWRTLLIAEWPWQCLLGAASTMGLICTIQALKLLPLSVAMPLMYLYPAMGALMSPALNREHPSGADWLAVALAFVSVALLTHGATSRQTATWEGVGWGLASAFFIALLVNLTRRQAKSRPTHVILFYLYLVNFIVCLPLMLIFDQPLLPAAPDLGRLFFFIAPMLILGILFMSWGYKYISAHRGGVIQTLEVVFGSLYGLVILGEPLTIWVAAGGLLMLASALIIAGSKS